MKKRRKPTAKPPKRVRASPSARALRVKKVIDDAFAGSPALFVQKVGITRDAVAKWLSGDREVSAASIQRIAEKTSFNPQWLANGDKNEDGKENPERLGVDMSRPALADALRSHLIEQLSLMPGSFSREDVTLLLPLADDLLRDVVEEWRARLPELRRSMYLTRKRVIGLALRTLLNDPSPILSGMAAKHLLLLERLGDSGRPRAGHDEKEWKLGLTSTFVPGNMPTSLATASTLNGFIVDDQGRVKSAMIEADNARAIEEELASIAAERAQPRIPEK